MLLMHASSKSNKASKNGSRCSIARAGPADASHYLCKEEARVDEYCCLHLAGAVLLGVALFLLFVLDVVEVSCRATHDEHEWDVWGGLNRVQYSVVS